MKLLEIIDKTFIGKFIAKKLDLILDTDPERIYVENIRSFFGTSTRIAKFLCETAVHQKLFKRQIALECPNRDCKRIVDSFDKEIIVPVTINCRNCELNEREEYEFSTSSMEKLVYYKLIKNG